MTRISDALELLTAQHAEIEQLLADLAAATAEERPVVFGVLADKLTTHLAAEQELFYPSIAVPTRSDMMEDHAQIKRLIGDLLWRELDESELPRLTDLSAMVARHIREQEDALFVTVAETMPTGVLRGMGDLLRSWSEQSLCVASWDPR